MNRQNKALSSREDETPMVWKYINQLVTRTEDCRFYIVRQDVPPVEGCVPSHEFELQYKMPLKPAQFLAYYPTVNAAKAAAEVYRSCLENSSAPAR